MLQLSSRFCIAFIAWALALLAGAWFLYYHRADRQVLSVASVVSSCRKRPSSDVTVWVRGYPVIAVTPRRQFAVVAGGSLYNSAVTDDRRPDAAINLVGYPNARRGHIAGPPLTLRLQGLTAMDVRGRVICSLGPGSGPGLVVDRTAWP